ncbi:MAG: TIGR03564 family F420-dependent LLM class oxidoreductase [Alphaproteobacteria bacterium]|nr:TIGR03564 family F420-dependent LLM class oxidoreductase [Alphaproteobacteria bacterium]MCB9928781.1 TIGR03564 family F420-dependent LLM class oxidoreductase [Alphaproteobacteria bacterium]
MSNDRFGVRWGLAGGTTLASVAETLEAARFAEQARFDSFWVSQAAGVDPVVALACIADQVPGLAEVGTSVVPLYGRHPLPFAQMVRTAQNALGGRLTLGVGAASAWYAEGKLGVPWDKPFSFTREFLDALQPLLAGHAADVTGDQLSAHAGLEIEARPTPILLAALGPRMLRFAGGRVQGTTLGQCGPRTIARYIRPHLEEGAAKAGRSEPPRIMALVRLAVTEDRAAAKALAREISGFYQAIPSYARVLEHEGLAEPADLHLIGSWQEVLDGIAAYAEAGVTDLRLQVAAPDERSRAASREALAAYLA